MNVPPLTLLYVPGDRPDRVEKAIASEAHAVIVDLEDGVAPAAKTAARANLPALLGERRDKPVYVRVNAGDCRGPRGRGHARDRRRLRAEGRRPGDVPSVGLPVHCLIESAAGVEAAYEIAKTRGVAGISLGEADLRSETGALEAGLDWARARIVNAAVAAGLPRPPQSVYPQLNDDEGLARSCRRGRELGHLGRVGHPSRAARDHRARVSPDRGGGDRARETAERLEHAGVATLAGGEFVDAAMLGAARQTIALAERYGTAAVPPVSADL